MSGGERRWNEDGLLHIGDGERILVVAPHADDESIGCGGLLLKHAAQTDVLLLSDGRYGFNPDDPGATPETTRLARIREFKEAMSFLGVRGYTMLDLPNCEIYRCYPAVRGYDVRGYDYVFVPSRFENNQDHLHARLFLKRMIREQRAKARLVEYEVWVPIPDPQAVLDIGDVIERKKELISLYASHLRCYDYVQFACGLNMYRGGRFKRRWVEAFFVPPRHYHAKMLVRALTTYAFREKAKAAVRRLFRRGRG